MIYKLYSITDNDSIENKFSCPLATENDAIAIRVLNSQLKEVPVELHSKYSLFCVGSFDTVSGTIVGVEPREVNINEAV